MKDYIYIGIYRNLKYLTLAQVALILIFFGFLAYSNAIFHPFIHDDLGFIQNNPQINNFHLRSIFAAPANPLAVTGIVSQYYRPLLEFIYRLEYQLFGLNSAAYHFVNILLHILNGILLFILLSAIFAEQRVMSLFIALVFILHPVQSEAVATISGISNLVFVLFALLSLICYVNGQRRQGAGAFFCYGSSLLYFILALLAKEQAVVVPFLLVLYEKLIKKTPAKEKKASFGYNNYFLIAAGYFVVRKSLLGFSLQDVFQFKEELLLRVLAIPGVLLTYLRLVILPYDLHYYRSADILKPFWGPAIILLVLLALLAGFIIKVKPPARNILLFGLGWFGLAILPVLNIVPLINEYSLIFTAEHFLYFPLIGLLIFLAFALQEMFSLFEKTGIVKVSLISLAAIILVSVVITVQNNSYWQDETYLFRRTLKYEKNFGRVRMLLAKAYYKKKMLPDAIREYDKALEIFLGYAEKAKGKKAKEFYFDFIETIYADLGTCYRETGDQKQAVEFYQKALTINPADAGVHNNLGVSYISDDNLEKAEEHFRKAIELDVYPFSQLAQKNLLILKQLAKDPKHVKR